MKHLIMFPLIVALLTGCITSASRRFNIDDVSSINLSCNEIFTIDIKGNATTGFVWRHVEDDDSQDILECIAESYETVKSKRNLCGAPGVFHFQFRAKTTGKCLLRFECLRPWEKDTPPSSTKGIVITVQ